MDVTIYYGLKKKKNHILREANRCQKQGADSDINFLFSLSPCRGVVGLVHMKRSNVQWFSDKSLPHLKIDYIRNNTMSENFFLKEEYL